MANMTNLEAVNAVLESELKQAKPNEAVLAACGLFKAKAERQPDPKVQPDRMEEGIPEKDLPWWIK